MKLCVKRFPQPSDVSRNMGICANHWPTNCQKSRIRGGNEIPIEPPSIFQGVLPSLVPAPQPGPRPTKRSKSDIRNPDIDEMPEFLESDAIDFDFFALNANILADEFDCIYYANGSTHIFHSKNINGPVHDWTITVSPESISCYKQLMAVKIPFLSYSITSAIGRSYLNVSDI